MNNRHKWAPAALAGAAAGFVNGFFGGGGGMVLVPLLTSRCSLQGQKAFASSVAVIFPLCMLSAAVYFLRGNLDLMEALPYLAGGLAGGLIGGRIFVKIPTVWIRRSFALLVLYGAWKSLTA